MSSDKTETFTIKIEPTPELMEFVNNLLPQIHCCSVENEIPCNNPAPFNKISDNIFLCQPCSDKFIGIIREVCCVEEIERVHHEAIAMGCEKEFLHLKNNTDMTPKEIEQSLRNGKPMLIPYFNLRSGELEMKEKNTPRIKHKKRHYDNKIRRKL